MTTACLNFRTEHSLGDGVAGTTALLDRAREFRVTAVGRADRNSLVGIETFLLEARRRGLHGVPGVELDLASDPATGAHDDPSSAYPIVLYASNETGLDNLGRLVSGAYRRGRPGITGAPAPLAFHPHERPGAGRPFVTLEDLERHHEGLIAQSPGLTGEVPRRILSNEVDSAERLANRLLEVFGRSSLYLGISCYGRPGEARLSEEIAGVARSAGLAIVAANEIDHLDPQDIGVRDLRRAIAAGVSYRSGSDAPSRPESHFRAPAELARLFREHPEALDNAVRLAEQCRLDSIEPRFPRYPLPAGRTEAAYLASLCRRKAPSGGRREARLDRELGLIAERGLAGYFLVLWDLVRHARARGVAVGPGRGAIVSSLVAFELGITEIDAHANGLSFDHFLAEAALGLPGFCLEVAASRREDLVAYLEHRYGSGHVARAGRLDIYSPRTAVRETGEALGMPPEDIAAVAKKASNETGADLALVVAQDSRLARQYRQDERVRTWLNLARRLQGLPRTYSPHPSGLVLAAGVPGGIPLETGADGCPVAQVAWNDASDRGLMRIDLPGRNDLIAPEPSARQAALFETPVPSRRFASSHRRALAGLATGRCPAPRDLEPFLLSMRPATLDDLVTAFSLRRLAKAGRDLRDRFLDRRDGREAFDLGDPALETALGPTEGFLVDQEQLVAIAETFSDLGPEEAEAFRRALTAPGIPEAPRSGGSDGRNRSRPAPDVRAEDLAHWRTRFVSGAVRRGATPGRAHEVFVGLLHAAAEAPSRAESLAEATLLLRRAYALTFSTLESNATTVRDESATRAARAAPGNRKPMSLVTARRRSRRDAQIAMPLAPAPNAGWNYRHTGTDGPR